MNMKELMEKRTALVTKMKALHQLAVDENRDLTDEEAGKWAAMERELAELKAQITRAQKIEDEERELRAGKPQVGALSWDSQFGRQEGQKPDKEAIRAVVHYVRTGDASGLEYRAYNDTEMLVGTPAAGGYAVPTPVMNQIIAKRDERLLAPRLGVRRIPGQGTTVSVPLEDGDDVLFMPVNEVEEIDRDAPRLGNKNFTLLKYAKYIELTWELLRDEDANLMAFINDWIGRGVAATHNKALITEALANGTASMTLASANNIAAAEIPKMVGKLAPEYQDGAQWILHPTTVALLQSLEGNPFKFAPSPERYAGQPDLWGYPVNQSSYMSVVGASAKSLLFGNFSFMGMREGTELTVLRDPYTAANKGKIRLWFWFDAVYGVLQAEAIRYATHPTA